MRTRSARRATPEMVVAMTALFIAITGTAAGLPGKDKVNSGDVKNETLKSEDLRDGQAVRSSDVVDEELLSSDIADGTLQTEDYAQGSVLSDDLGSGAVETEDLGAGVVQPQNIADAAVNSLSINNGSVAGVDLGGNSVSSSKIADGAVGATDLAEPQVFKDPTPYDFGDQDEGNNDYEYGSSTASCPSGWTAIAGGGVWNSLSLGGAGGDELQAITQSGPLGGDSWIATGVSDVDNDDFQAAVLCLPPGT